MTTLSGPPPTRTRGRASTPEPSTRGAHATTRTTRVALAIDGAGCLLIAAGLLVAPAWLVAGVGIATPTPLRVLGAVFVLAGVVNLTAARVATASTVLGAIALDAAFVGATLALLGSGALVDAAGRGTGLVVVGGAVSTVFGTTKAAGLLPATC